MGVPPQIAQIRADLPVSPANRGGLSREKYPSFPHEGAKFLLQARQPAVRLWRRRVVRPPIASPARSSKMMYRHVSLHQPAKRALRGRLHIIRRPRRLAGARQAPEDHRYRTGLIHGKSGWHKASPVIFEIPARADQRLKACREAVPNHEAGINPGENSGWRLPAESYAANSISSWYSVPSRST